MATKKELEKIETLLSDYGLELTPNMVEELVEIIKFYRQFSTIVSNSNADIVNEISDLMRGNSPYTEHEVLEKILMILDEALVEAYKNASHIPYMKTALAINNNFPTSLDGSTEDSNELTRFDTEADYDPEMLEGKNFVDINNNTLH